MISVEEESSWIQSQAFKLLERIVSEPLYYVGASILEEDRIKKLLLAVNSLHAVIIQSIQVGNLKRAIRYLLFLRRISIEVEAYKIQIENAIEKKYKDFHALGHE